MSVSELSKQLLVKGKRCTLERRAGQSGL
jgi:hypothetical protein